MTRTNDTASPADAASGTHRSVKGRMLDDWRELNHALLLAHDTRALRPAEAFILTLIASKSSDGTLDDARVSIDDLVAWTGIKASQVSVHLKRLRDNGWVVQDFRGGYRKDPATGTAKKMRSVYSIGSGPVIEATDDLPPENRENLPPENRELVPPENRRPVVPRGLFPEVDPHPFRGSAAAAPKARKESPEKSREKRTGKRDATALDDLNALNEWLGEAFGWGVVMAWDSRIDDMWSERWNWKRIYNTIAKAERVTGRTILDAEDIPEPPAPPCAYNCDDRRMTEVAHDTRTGELHETGTVRFGRHVHRLLVPCPACRPEDFNSRRDAYLTHARPQREQTPEEIAAILAASPLAS